MNLFPDTNFFLHFKHAHEIDWSIVTQAENLTLQVGRAVNKELDRKKYELRGRPQDRAREYTQKLAQVAMNGLPKVLRETRPSIFLDVLPPRPAGWKCPPELDAAWLDDVLIADILAFRHYNPSAAVALITGDPGLMTKARLHGIAIISANRPEWLLPNENSDQDKELLRLRREIQEMKSSGPVIAHELTVNGVRTSAIQLATKRHARLTEEDVGFVMAELATRHPERFRPGQRKLGSSRPAQRCYPRMRFLILPNG